MKKVKNYLLLIVCCVLNAAAAVAQCSICSKTASQMGEEAARGLNGGILYLASAPLLIVGYIGYRWWKSNKIE